MLCGYQILNILYIRRKDKNYSKVSLLPSSNEYSKDLSLLYFINYNSTPLKSTVYLLKIVNHIYHQAVIY
jgi:hypothetical protein